MKIGDPVWHMAAAVVESKRVGMVDPESFENLVHALQGDPAAEEWVRNVADERGCDGKS